MKKKICIIGHFADGTEFNDGQTVKTKEIYEELKKENFIIKKTDTYNFKKNIFSFLYKILKNYYNSQYIILIVASGGAKILIPLLTTLNLRKNKKICYCCVGSWLDERVDKNFILKKSVKKLSTIFVETDDLLQNLKKREINNVKKMYNFKRLNLEQKSSKKKKNTFCIFSRIMEEKGIGDAIYVFNKLNNNGYNCHLDIYGPIKKEYEEVFLKEVDKGNNITYCGSKKPNESIKYVSQYTGLIFPTHYIKEGLPGTLIDAYFSGTPIISSKWKSAEEFVPNQVGFVYEFANKNELYKLMKKILDNPSLIKNKENGCIDFSNNFLPQKAIKPLINFIEGDNKND